MPQAAATKYFQHQGHCQNYHDIDLAVAVS